MIVLLNVSFSVLLLLLLASGLAVIFGLMGIINFAHGEFLMLGAFAAFWTTRFAPFWLALVVAPLVVAAVAVLIEAGLIRRLYRRPVESILATWGLSIVIREGMKALVGPEPRSIHDPIGGTIDIFGATYPRYRLVVMAAIILLFLLLIGLSRATRLGTIARAVIESPDLAASQGVNVARTYRVTFALGAALAGIAGALVSPLVAIHPEMGPTFVVNGFLAVVVGGPGSLGGLLAAAGLLGSSQSLAVQYLSPATGTIVVLLFAVVLMRIRPLGLLRRAS